jgi:hypothetical protein
MRRTHALLVGGIIAAVGLAGVVPATAQSGTDKPQAPEIGVTASEIHIAVIADVDNPLAPGLFKGAVEGVKAGAAYLNSKAGGGGLAGRKVVVDFYDSQVNANAARNATIDACENDLAMVGTMVLFLTSVDDMVNCKDQAGQVTGLPDLSSTAVGIPEACAPTSFPAIGTQVQCDTITENPQTYNGNQGEGLWLVKTKGGKLHGPFLVSSDTKDANRGGTLLALSLQHAGIEPDQATTVAKSATEPQSAYTGIINQMKAKGSNFAFSGTAPAGTQALRAEAQLQGLPSSVSFTCTGCYNSPESLANPSVWEGEYATLGVLPFDEAKANPMLASFLQYMRKVGGTPDAYSSYAWQAVIAFRDAVNATVQAKGVNGVTRANLVVGIRSLTDFSAEGMAGTHSFKNAKLTACFVETRFEHGKWHRVYPSKAGTFDCNPKNAIDITANLLGR